MKKIFCYIASLWNKLYLIFLKHFRPMEFQIRALYENEYINANTKIVRLIPYSALTVIQVLEDNSHRYPLKYDIIFSYPSGAKHINQFIITLEFSRNQYQSNPKHSLEMFFRTSEIFGLSADNSCQICHAIGTMNDALFTKILTTYNQTFP